jgi:hypothetical protein
MWARVRLVKALADDSAGMISAPTFASHDPSASSHVVLRAASVMSWSCLLAGFAQPSAAFTARSSSAKRNVASRNVYATKTRGHSLRNGLWFVFRPGYFTSI